MRARSTSAGLVPAELSAKNHRCDAKDHARPRKYLEQNSFSNRGVQGKPKCRSRYAALRARGHSYGRALRGGGDRLLGVACVLLQRGMLFDPDYGSSAPA